ncbi:hypothetical protein BIWAKO_05765 [Bosea sp. BIWAKO-01]|nr:hypothetical protein BIWAKO_05765 [Bosea sp. BIWAKO-01]
MGRAMVPSPSEAAEIWSSEVLIPIAGRHFLSRLEAMERWLGEWNIPYQVVPPVPHDAALVLRFPRDRFARAFAAMQRGMRREEDARASRSGRCSRISSWTTSMSTVCGCA